MLYAEVYGDYDSECSTKSNDLNSIRYLQSKIHLIDFQCLHDINDIYLFIALD